MNFIIEVLRKKENENVLVFVVRNQQGFPMLVADTLDEALVFVQSQIDKALSAKSDV